MISQFRSAFMLACVAGVGGYGYHVSKLDASNAAPQASAAAPAPASIQQPPAEQPAGILPIPTGDEAIDEWLPSGGSINNLTDAPLFTLSSKAASRSTAAASRYTPAPSRYTPAAPRYTSTATAASRYNPVRPATNRRTLPSYTGSTTESRRTARYATNSSARGSANPFSQHLSRTFYSNSFSRELRSAGRRFK